MAFLKRLFSGNRSTPRSRDGGLYFHVRLYNIPGRESPDDEIVQIRINPSNDVSLDDDGNYFVRKDVVGTRKFRRGELLVFFDITRQIKDVEVTGGVLVATDDYEEYLDRLQKPAQSDES